MKTNKFVNAVTNFIKKLMMEDRYLLINPEIKEGNKEVEEMINNYYWNWDECKY